MGQSCRFCDTTQIDVIHVLSITHTIICAPMDNGWVPVGPYLVARSVRPLEVHSPATPRPASTIRDSLLVCSTDYFSSSTVLTI